MGGIALPIIRLSFRLALHLTKDIFAFFFFEHRRSQNCRKSRVRLDKCQGLDCTTVVSNYLTLGRFCLFLLFGLFSLHSSLFFATLCTKTWHWNGFPLLQCGGVPRMLECLQTALKMYPEGPSDVVPEILYNNVRERFSQMWRLRDLEKEVCFVFSVLFNIAEWTFSLLFDLFSYIRFFF